jgi:hypothetical protein
VLIKTACAVAPRYVRLPPHVLRFTTAGRIACSAGQLVASTSLRSRTSDVNRFIDRLGTLPAGSLAVALGRFAPWSPGLRLRWAFRERGRLAFAAAPLLFKDLGQLRDALLLLLELPPELRVLLK